MRSIYCFSQHASSGSKTVHPSYPSNFSRELVRPSVGRHSLGGSDVNNFNMQTQRCPDPSCQKHNDGSQSSPTKKPFRFNAKYKIELCRHFLDGSVCPFGDNCIFAHGKHELEQTKLIDLHRAGTVDANTFRTRPCMSVVSTGSCPFRNRCCCVHDPRVETNISSWLPHCEMPTLHLGTSVHIDAHYHMLQSTTNNGHPFGPWMRMQPERHCNDYGELEWETLYLRICHFKKMIPFNNERKLEREVGAANTSAFSSSCTKIILSEQERLQIALKMRRAHGRGLMYIYSPKHLVHGELCMILQSRAFCLNVKSPYMIQEVPIKDDYKLKHEGRRVITVHEIAFGPMCQRGVLPVALWFDINSHDILECTPQMVKQRMRKMKRGASVTFNAFPGQKQISQENVRQKESMPDACNPFFGVECSNLDNMVDGEKRISNPSQKSYFLKILRSDEAGNDPFFPVYPMDIDAYNLVSDIMRHRLGVLLSRRHSSLPCNENTIDQATLELQEFFLRSTFMAQMRHWKSLCAWTINTSREYFTDATNIPPVDGYYERSLSNNCEYIESRDYPSLRHPREKSSRLIGCDRSRAVYTDRIWKSFLTFLLELKDTDSDESAQVGRRKCNNTATPSTQSMHIAQSKIRKRNCLSVFDNLSSGKTIAMETATLAMSRIRHLRRGLCENHDEDGISEFLTSDSSSWHVVKGHYLKARPETSVESCTGRLSPRTVMGICASGSCQSGICGKEGFRSAAQTMGISIKRGQHIDYTSI